MCVTLALSHARNVWWADSLLRALGRNLSCGQLRDLEANCGPDNGVWRLRDFLAAMAYLVNKPDPVGELVDLVRAFDRDMSGMMTGAELVLALQHVRESGLASVHCLDVLRDPDVDAAVEEAARHSDLGRIDYEEFIVMLMAE